MCYITCLIRKRQQWSYCMIFDLPHASVVLFSVDQTGVATCVSQLNASWSWQLRKYSAKMRADSDAARSVLRDNPYG